MKYLYAGIIAISLGFIGPVSAEEEAKIGKDDFVSTSITDVFEKVNKVTTGDAPILESMDDYEMSASGERIPKKKTIKRKATALEEKLGQ